MLGLGTPNLFVVLGVFSAKYAAKVSQICAVLGSEQEIICTNL